MPLKYINNPIIKDCLNQCMQSYFNDANLSEYLPKSFYRYIKQKFDTALESNRRGNTTQADSLTRTYDIIINHGATFNVWSIFMKPYLQSDIASTKKSLYLFWDEHIKRKPAQVWLETTRNIWKFNRLPVDDYRPDDDDDYNNKNIPSKKPRFRYSNNQSSPRNIMKNDIETDDEQDEDSYNMEIVKADNSNTDNQNVDFPKTQNDNKHYAVVAVMDPNQNNTSGKDKLKQILVDSGITEEDGYDNDEFTSLTPIINETNNNPKKQIKSLKSLAQDKLSSLKFTTENKLPNQKSIVKNTSIDIDNVLDAKSSFKETQSLDNQSKNKSEKQIQTLKLDKSKVNFTNQNPNVKSQNINPKVTIKPTRIESNKINPETDTLLNDIDEIIKRDLMTLPKSNKSIPKDNNQYNVNEIKRVFQTHHPYLSTPSKSSVNNFQNLANQQQQNRELQDDDVEIIKSVKLDAAQLEKMFKDKLQRQERRRMNKMHNLDRLNAQLEQDFSSAKNDTALYIKEYQSLKTQKSRDMLQAKFMMQIVELSKSNQMSRNYDYLAKFCFYLHLTQALRNTLKYAQIEQIEFYKSIITYYNNFFIDLFERDTSFFTKGQLLIQKYDMGIFLSIEDLKSIQTEKASNSSHCLSTFIISYYINLLSQENINLNVGVYNPLIVIDIISNYMKFKTSSISQKKSLNHATSGIGLNEFDLFNYDFIIFPILQKNHWTVLIFNLAKNQALYYNSFGVPNRANTDYKGINQQHRYFEIFKLYITSVRSAIIDSATASKNNTIYKRQMSQKWINLDLNKMSISDVGQPKQKDEFNCGLFLLYIVESYLLNLDMNISKYKDTEDMINIYKKKILQKIINSLPYFK